MKYLKKYEETGNFYGVSSIDVRNMDQILIPNVFDYLGIDIYDADYYYDEDITTKYNVNVRNFFEEIFLNKKVTFKSIDKEHNDPIISGIVKDTYFELYNEIFLKLSIESKNIWHNGWWIVSNESFISVPDYDANKKPLHKKVELLKTAEQFNI